MPADDFNLERLVRIPASEAIGGEASHFTPWLATHIDLLSDRLGLRLNFGEGPDDTTILKNFTEVSVGNFFLDVMAFTDDDRVVAIENQYGRSDHSHLGQAITYASGVGADFVVWIAEEFSDAHLAAIRWLNERTDEDCGVFAVELAFYRIDDSAPAPLFTTLVEPSEWQRLARKSLAASQDWTADEFLELLADDGDRVAVSEILRRNTEAGGGIWFGKKGGGSLLIHPIPSEHPTIGISMNSSHRASVSGLWTQFQDSFRSSAYEPVAELLGLPIEGPASSIPLSRLDVDALWTAALETAILLQGPVGRSGGGAE